MATRPPIPSAWLRSGYERSLTELRDAFARSDHEAAFHALFAALNWAASIFDHFKDPPNAVVLSDRNVIAVQWKLCAKDASAHTTAPRSSGSQAPAVEVFETKDSDPRLSGKWLRTDEWNHVGIGKEATRAADFVHPSLTRRGRIVETSDGDGIS